MIAEENRETSGTTTGLAVKASLITKNFDKG
jgi:hypothetical protein